LNILQTNLTLTREQAGAALAAWLGAPVQCTAIEPLHGGMINTVLRLEFDRAPYSAVIKLSGGDAPPGDYAGGDFTTEARALAYLRSRTRFPSPQVYRVEEPGRSIPYAFLLIENIPGACLAGLDLGPGEQDAIDRQLAAALLELHGHTRERYGDIDEQPGRDTWADVFLPRLREVRAQPELARRLPASVLADVDRAIGLAREALLDQGPPTLIHGDIWAGNLIVRPEEGGWRLAGIVDPGIHYADVEEELAYLEVFGARREAFFAAYTAQRPLRPGYQRRRLFYWLRTALIHVWLFGDQPYRDFTAQTAAEICMGSS
jgi:fructosamine-3-kinase